MTKEELAKRERIEKLKSKYREAPLDYQGRLYIDDKYKKPGKVQRIDNDDPATRKNLEKLGYTVVIDENIKVGSGSLREPSNMGSAIHIEQAVYGQSQPGILYEIDEEEYIARKEVEAEHNEELLKAEIEKNQHSPDQQKHYNKK